MKRFKSAEEKLAHIEAKAAERRDRFIAKRIEAGLKRVLLWIPGDLLERLDTAVAERKTDRMTLINSFIETGLRRYDDDSSTAAVSSLKMSEKRHYSEPDTTSTLEEIPADAVNSRQAAELLGFKSPSALDNAIRGADYQVGFVKPGMEGSGRQAVFVGKGKPERGGPDRNLWRVEDDI